MRKHGPRKRANTGASFLTCRFAPALRRTKSSPTGNPVWRSGSSAVIDMRWRVGRCGLMCLVSGRWWSFGATTVLFGAALTGVQGMATTVSALTLRQAREAHVCALGRLHGTQVVEYGGQAVRVTWWRQPSSRAYDGDSGQFHARQTARAFLPKSQFSTRPSEGAVLLVNAQRWQVVGVTGDEATAGSWNVQLELQA